MDTPVAVTPRDRVLSDDELVKVWRASDAVAKPFGPIVKMLIATGQRREEVAALDWRELDRANASWILPRERAKNATSHVVPLNELALSILDTAAGGENWPKRGIVFPTSGGRSFIGYSKGKAQLDKKLVGDNAVRPWRLHDLRRTLATGMQRLGVRFEVTEAILNHVGASKAGVAGIYQRHDWAPEKAAALQAWSDHIGSLLAPADKTNVVELRLQA
jgi:integrase